MNYCQKFLSDFISLTLDRMKHFPWKMRFKMLVSQIFATNVSSFDLKCILHNVFVNLSNKQTSSYRSKFSFLITFRCKRITQASITINLKLYFSHFDQVFEAKKCLYFKSFDILAPFHALAVSKCFRCVGSCVSLM